MTFFKNN